MDGDRMTEGDNGSMTGLHPSSRQREPFWSTWTKSPSSFSLRSCPFPFPSLQRNYPSLFCTVNLKHHKCHSKPDLSDHDLELFRGYLRCCSPHLPCAPLLAAKKYSQWDACLVNVWHSMGVSKIYSVSNGRLTWREIQDWHQTLLSLFRQPSMNYSGVFLALSILKVLFLITVTSTSCDPCKQIKNMHLLNKSLVSLHLDFWRNYLKMRLVIQEILFKSLHTHNRSFVAKHE